MENRSENRFGPPVGEALLSIEVTTNCNLHCLHCIVQSSRGKGSFLSLPLVQDILKEGYEMGYRRLHVTGGEPLLWERLPAALDDAFSLGYESVLINTNGTLLSKDICSRLSAYGKVSISISLDGPKESHAHIRGCGQYERTRRGAANALDAGISMIVFTIMYRSLLAQLPLFTSDVYNKFPSISHMCIIPLMNTTNTSFLLSNELLAPNDFIRLIRGISLLNLLGAKIDVLNEPLAYVAADLMKCPMTQWAAPVRREKSIILLADGTLSLSHFSETNFGQYKRGRLRGVFASAAYKKAVSPDESVCPLCRFHVLCAGHGLCRPTEPTKYSPGSTCYCKSVLDNILTLQRNLDLKCQFLSTM